MYTAYWLYHQYGGLWYLEGLVDKCQHTFIQYDRYNDVLLYTNKKGEDCIEVASIKRLISSLIKVKLCGSLEKAESIYDQNMKLNRIRHDLFNAIEDYKACMAFKLA